MPPGLETLVPLVFDPLHQAGERRTEPLHGLMHVEISGQDRRQKHAGHKDDRAPRLADKLREHRRKRKADDAAPFARRPAGPRDQRDHAERDGDKDRDDDGVVGDDKGRPHAPAAEDRPPPEEDQERKDSDRVADGGIDEKIGHQGAHQAEAVVDGIGHRPDVLIPGDDAGEVARVEVDVGLIPRVIRHEGDHDKEGRNDHQKGCHRAPA